VIVIAHRISSALCAQRSLLLDGTQTPHGTHDKLLALALYRNFVGALGDGKRHTAADLRQDREAATPERPMPRAQRDARVHAAAQSGA
jgi:hypothetical protein